MLRKQMFTIAFILLLSGLIFNTMSCQQCKDILETPEKVKKAEKKIEKAEKEIEVLRKRIQPIPPPIPPEPGWHKKLIDYIIIIIIIIGAVLGLKHLWIYFNRNKKD